MKWNTIRKKIFLITSKEESICPCCGSWLKPRDYRKHVHKIVGEKKNGIGSGFISVRKINGGGSIINCQTVCFLISIMTVA